MGWVSQIEMRPRARVPIIHLVHLCTVEADISLGLAAHDTTDVVFALCKEAGPALPILAAFLKVYLSQLYLDMPFTGGLGSFKLYALLAVHIARYRRMCAKSAEDADEHDSSQNPEATEENLGLILLSFLQHYGNPSNLNLNTNLKLLPESPT